MCTTEFLRKSFHYFYIVNTTKQVHYDMSHLCKYILQVLIHEIKRILNNKFHLAKFVIVVILIRLATIENLASEIL